MTNQNFDDEDVAALLARADTADGPGFTSEDELPESDVEEDDDQ
jgi:hypothetical protein